MGGGRRSRKYGVGVTGISGTQQRLKRYPYLAINLIFRIIFCRNIFHSGREVRMFKKGLAIFSVSLVGLLLLGSAYQASQQNRDRLAFPAPGAFYFVDGLRLHLDCRGSGAPVLVMEAGLSSGSISWDLVHDALARETRVCAYDRPGIDWSEPIDRVVDAKEISGRLNQLLTLAEVDGPKILLGMSAGGIYVREFYKNHPKDIVGMVLVDSSHEQQQILLPTFEGEDSAFSFLEACRLLQPFGLVRISGVARDILDEMGVEKRLKEKMLASVSQSHACSAMYWEGQSFKEEIIDKVPPESIGDLPLLVLSRGKAPSAYPEYGITLEQATASDDAWGELQRQLMGLSTRGRRYSSEQSGHVIQLEQPLWLIEKVNAFVLEVREL